MLVCGVRPRGVPVRGARGCAGCLRDGVVIFQNSPYTLRSGIAPVLLVLLTSRTRGPKFSGFRARACARGKIVSFFAGFYNSRLDSIIAHLGSRVPLVFFVFAFVVFVGFVPSIQNGVSTKKMVSVRRSIFVHGSHAEMQMRGRAALLIATAPSRRARR